jgi:calnexin
MQSDITFDNIYIGHSIEDAAAFRAETYDIKRPIEEEEEAKTKPKPSEIPSSSDLSFKNDPVGYVRDKFDLFVTLAKHDPIEAIKTVPEVAGGLGGILALTIAFIFAAVAGGSSAAPSKEEIKKTAQKAKAAAVDAKDKAAEAVTSGADAAKAEVNKRTTRSNAAE